MVASLEIMKNNMINNQLKPSGINDDKLLQIFDSIPKELFLDDEKKSISYHDGNIEVKKGRWLLSNATIAKMIDSVNFSKDDVILEIGAGCGYTTAILESLASIVVGIESDITLREKANKIIAQIGLDSAIIINGDHNKGHLKSAPYDKIFIFGSVSCVPDCLFDQLAENGKLLCGVKNSSDNSYGKAFVFSKNKSIINSSVIFEGNIPEVPGFEKQENFEF